MVIALRKRWFQMRGPRGDLHPMLAVRVGPLIITTTLYSQRKHMRRVKSGLNAKEQRLWERLNPATPDPKHGDKG